MGPAEAVVAAATTAATQADVNFENLYPALVSCFVVILLGYISGRVNLISETEAKGMNTFTGYFALPALIFVNMVSMDISTVNWLFLLAIFLAKALVFFIVMGVHLLVIRPKSIGSAGLLAIFATQSNDFAIGYPIVSALYNSTHPNYVSYMYLLAPINLAILNPISFFLLELQKQNTHNEAGRGRCVFALKVFRNIILNPIILMTLLGIICNFLFHHTVPLYLQKLLEVLGNAFSACALFSLGLRMVGKVHNLKGIRLIVPGLLIIAKLLALPVLIRELVNFLHVGTDSDDTLAWSTFGFLYGTIPSAPTVFVFAVQYGVEIDLVATSMVACTFVSAPWMFVSAKMITLTKTDPSDYIDQLQSFTFNISIVSLVASLWILLVFGLTKKINKIPHKYTACLVISQIFSCIGAILCKFVDHRHNFASYVQFLFFTGGVYSSRMWTAIIAITLVFMESRSLCFIVFKLQPVFFAAGLGLPLLLSISLLVFDKETTAPSKQINPNFMYGAFQAIIAVCLLVLCFIVSAGCLILHEIYRKRHEQYRTLSQAVSAQHDEPPSTSVNGCGEVNCCNLDLCAGTLPTIVESTESSPGHPVVDIEDLMSSNLDGHNSCPSGFGCKTETAGEYCQGIIQQYKEPVDEDLELIEEDRNSHNPQILRHTVLLILLLCSMFIGLAVSIWTLIMEQMSGIYIELAFLDSCLNFGQSIIVFAVFGADTREIVLPLLKRWRKVWLRDNRLLLPMESELSTETLHICEQFRTHHLMKCRSDIARNKRWGLKIYDQVFSGRTLVCWLIEIGLARDRNDAVNYARHLIEGRILRHINEVYHFYDKNLLYSFN